MKEDDYIYVPNLNDIRFCEELITDYNDNEQSYQYTVFRFEVFKKPYFWELIGKKKWCFIDRYVGIDYGINDIKRRFKL